MLLAQLQPVSSDAAGSWLFGAAAIAAVVYLVLAILKTVKDLKAPPVVVVDPATKVVTQKEFVDLQEDVKRLDLYTHQSVHKQSNDMHTLHLKMVETPAIIKDEVNASLARLSERLADNCKMLAGVKTTVDLLVRHLMPGEKPRDDNS